MANFNEMSDSLEVNYDLSIMVESIHRDLKNEAIGLRNLLIFQDDASLQEEISNIQTTSNRITENIASLESLAYTENQQALVRELTEVNQEFNDYKNQLITHATNGNREEATVLMDEYSNDLHEEFFDLVSEISSTFEENMHTSLQTVKSDFNRDIVIEFVILAAAIFLIMIVLFRAVWSLTSRLNKVSSIMSRIAAGEEDLSKKVEVIDNDEIDEVAKSFNRMTASVSEQREREKDIIWTKTNLAEVTTSLSGLKSIKSLAETFLSKVVPLVGGSHAVFYMKEEVGSDEDTVFKLRASYAFKERKHVTNELHPGEGIIGQAVLEKTPIILSNVPSDYITVQSGLGEAPPLTIYVLPILFEGDVIAVLEIASFKVFSEMEQDFLEEVIEDMGIMLESINSRIRLAKALEESQALTEEVQAQSEELQTQQDELRTTNEELEQQTIALRQSEEKLQAQQEELEQTNAELEEKANTLREQNQKYEQKNNELEQTKVELEERAKQLALSSRYKSEFLANMSHELRTPLNSMLILSSLLSDNMDGKLSEKQVEYAKTIHSSGKDLLVLINDILDLSKIESGKMDVHPGSVSITNLAEYVESHFRPVANDKKLDFDITVNSDVPTSIYSDEVKIQQVLKNLLGNAFKFTKKGNVALRIGYDQSSGQQPMFVFTVHDTGTGISKENQELIFEAFQQADGTTSRKFGGTGLGLSISKEIASLLGGSITVESEEGQGSTFIFYIGDYDEDYQPASPKLTEEAAASVEEIDSVPKEPLTKTVKEEETPAPEEDNGHIKRLLIVDDDKIQRNSMMELIGDMDIIMKAVSSGSEALEELKRDSFDCIILDLGLTDTSGFQLLEKIMENNANRNLKIFVYTGRDLTSKEELYLNKYAQTIIIKDEQSPRRLKEELELYLYQDSPEPLNLEILDTEQNPADSGLSGKRILLVDDDVRNVYALSSILELSGMEVIFAENGLEALDILKMDTAIDLILMDIMMPEMDGNEAIIKIRNMPSYKDLPIIAVTAKAMNEDRERSLEAGASDYIVKPIDPDQLISLINVWLFEDQNV